MGAPVRCGTSGAAHRRARVPDIAGRCGAPGRWRTGVVRTTVEPIVLRRTKRHRVDSTQWTVPDTVTTARRWSAAPGTRRGHRGARRRCRSGSAGSGADASSSRQGGAWRLPGVASAACAAPPLLAAFDFGFRGRFQIGCHPRDSSGSGSWSSSSAAAICSRAARARASTSRGWGVLFRVLT